MASVPSAEHRLIMASRESAVRHLIMESILHPSFSTEDTEDTVDTEYTEGLHPSILSTPTQHFSSDRTHPLRTVMTNSPSSADLASALTAWAERNSVRISPSVAIQHDDARGFHFRAVRGIEPDDGIAICSIPSNISLSALNALEDEDFTVFKQLKYDDLSTEAIGYFYLMRQYLLRERSFWWPYIAALPTAETLPPTPFCRQDDAYHRWLKGTDVEYTYRQRMELHRGHYNAGVAMLQDAGADATPYTWELFIWAFTMFTSRSFTSDALRPIYGHQWHIQKALVHGRRCSVDVDLAQLPAEDTIFPVLLPILDISNHNPKGHVDLVQESMFIGLHVTSSVKSGDEVFYNYGRKSNDELLLGYGFCIPNNPNDRFLLKLRPPPQTLQDRLRLTDLDFFTPAGEWSGGKATFALRKLATVSDYSYWEGDRFDTAGGLFKQLPKPLLAFMMHQLEHERGMPFQPRDTNLVYHEIRSKRSYAPLIAQKLYESIDSKWTMLEWADRKHKPQDVGQQQAFVYARAQLSILHSLRGPVNNFLDSMLRDSLLTPYEYLPQPEDAFDLRLWDLETLLVAMAGSHGGRRAPDFLAGIEANLGSDDPNVLRSAGWDHTLVMLAICYLRLAPSDEPWTSLPLEVADYANLDRIPSTAAEMEDADEFMRMVAVAANACPGSAWSDKRWSATFIVSSGMRVVNAEGFELRVSVMTPDGPDYETRVVVLLQMNGGG